MRIRLAIFAASIAAFILGSMATAAAETTECTQITSIPTVISIQGVYCLKGNLATGLTSGQMIDIQTNNVTIDMNGFKLGGSAAGTGTTTSGIFAQGRKNIVIRNGNVRGFRYGVHIIGDSDGILVEDMNVDGNRGFGIYIVGQNATIRGNKVINTQLSDLGSVAYGIFLGSSSGSVIENNVVSIVQESNDAYGIRTDSTDSSLILNNSIFNLSGPNEYGIANFSGNAISVMGNVIIDVLGGDIGILNTLSTNIDCFNNVTNGFTTGQTGCNNLSGNQFN